MAIITGTTRGDRLNGTTGDDSISGLDGADTITGAAGNDFIDGGAGADSISGGDGNDTIVYDANDKKISGDAGTDTLLFSGTAQSLNLNNLGIQGIEALRLEGGGGHTVTLRASDVVRVSDTDTLTITSSTTGNVNTKVSIGTGWTFSSLTADSQSAILKNGLATLIVQLPVSIVEFSNNAAITVVAGSDTSVFEDEGNAPLASLLTATGQLQVSDPNSWQASFQTAVVSAAGNLGSLTLQTNGSYTYQVSNAAVQGLTSGPPKVETFTVRSLDGTAKDITFAIIGVNDAAVIGAPTVTSVTEDININSTGLLTASGNISISDADSGQSSFQTVVGSAAGNLGSLVLQANGSYIYRVSNASVQYLGAGASKTDSFTVAAIDGTTKQISFTINGTNDAAVITLGQELRSVTEDQAGDGNYMLVVSAKIGITDKDSGQDSFQTAVDSAAGNLGSLTLQADGNYTYSVSNSSVQFLTTGAQWFDKFTVKSLDGTTKDIIFTINGKDDKAIIGDPPNSSVTEDQNVVGGNLTASGKLSITDADIGQASFRTTVSSSDGNLGNLTLLADGTYTYSVSNASVQYLRTGEKKIDTFTVTSFDGTTKDISFIINGLTDTLPFGEPTNNNVTEDQNGNGHYLLRAAGTLSFTDAYSGPKSFLSDSAIGNFGILSVKADGSYTYSVPNSSVQYLGAGETKIDTFTVKALDGTSQDISFTINGVNDDAVIGTPVNNFVNEDQNVIGFFTLMSTGTLSITDADSGQESFRTDVVSSINNIGTLTLLADGGYTYLVNNLNVQSLGFGSEKVDTFTVTALDGTQKSIDFHIVGQNDAPVILQSDKIVTAQVAEFYDFYYLANSSFVQTVSGSFKVYDVDVGDTLTLESQKLTGFPGSLDLKFAGTDNTGARIVEWTYSWTDRSLNYLQPTDDAHQYFNVVVKDSQSSVATQTIDIKLNGTSEPSLDLDPSFSVITELPSSDPGQAQQTEA